MSAQLVWIAIAMAIVVIVVVAAAALWRWRQRRLHNAPEDRYQLLQRLGEQRREPVMATLRR